MKNFYSKIFSSVSYLYLLGLSNSYNLLCFDIILVPKILNSRKPIHNNALIEIMITFFLLFALLSIILISPPIDVIFTYLKYYISITNYILNILKMIYPKNTFIQKLAVFFKYLKHALLVIRFYFTV